jgi:hypothetical protein
MTIRTITEKQEALIGKLLLEKSLPDGFQEALGSVSALTMAEASLTIDKLFRFPRKPVASESNQVLHDALLAIPLSYYAIPMEDIGHALTSTRGDNDVLFLRLTENTRSHRRFLSQVHGGPGGFWKTSLRRDDTLAILRHLATDPTKFALLFAEKHGVCGKCGADLTDPESRRLKFGPTCRKVWGL